MEMQLVFQLSIILSKGVWQVSNINEKLDRLKACFKIKTSNRKRTCNEVNIRMFCYEPEDEMAVRHFTKQQKDIWKCCLICHNLYHVFWKYVRKNIKEDSRYGRKKEATTLKIGY